MEAQSIYAFYSDLSQFKINLQSESSKIFNLIANLQMKSVNIKNELRKLVETNPNQIDKIKSYEDYLSLTIDLPLLFGFIIVEKRRQFEWFDFYSKGVINKLTEQLTLIIEHEKLFRNLWLKKFNNFLTLLDQPINTILPNIDLTLIGNNKIELLEGMFIERSDIETYIGMLEKYQQDKSKNFSELVNKNYHDLIKSTNNMKILTKRVSSLSVINSNNDLEQSTATTNQDISIISNLQKHINRLEYLLHQQEMKKLSSWPPTLKMDNDPTKLLQKNTVINNRTVSASSQSQVLDTSVIDKHLDNIKLKKENNESKKELEDLKIRQEQEIKNHENKNKELKDKNEQLQSQNEKMKIENDSTINEINDLKTSNEELQSTINSKDDEIAKLKEELESLKELKSKDETTISQLTTEKSNLIKTNNDLQTNLDTLELKITSTESQHLNEFCLILECMGLLLVKEEGDETTFKIKRVKGLKKDKKSKRNGYSDENIESDLNQSKALIDLNIFGGYNNIPDEIKQQGFFYNAINKRFQEVEQFARENAKENKKLKDLVDRL
ncbi:unnamed protein product [Candida verbasci]|uniref:Autophagy protein ATG17-like domain-containing protein n=1 Tax=Candida verbasci TaxID=1227364 RepID=A0A9W4XBL9_9ASCO|nr:unnamed protein product [Candida verbasci]